MDTIRLEAIKLWVGLAWCDGSMSTDEERALDLLIRNSQQLTEDERAAADRIVRAEDALPDFAMVLQRLADALRDREPGVRTRLYRSAVLLCQLGDARLSASEQQHLALLRSSLRLSEADAQACHRA